MGKSQPMDLSRFDALTQAQEDGLAVEIRDPAGEPLGLTIVVAGPDSERQRAAERKQIDRRLRRQSLAQMTADELLDVKLRGLADSVMSWSPIVLDGADLPCTPENAVKLLKRVPFIREQVDAAAGNRAGFLPS